MTGQTAAVEHADVRTPVRAPERTRLAYLDNLKTLLIAGIIASHAVMGYAAFGSWTYQDVQESTLSPAMETIFTLAVFSFGGLFLMALFFLISGLLTQDSLVRKGSSRFVRDRLLRLGLPFAVYTLVVWPMLEFALHEPLLHQGSYWRSFTNTDPVLDSGPMWFVGVLLLFSLALVGWRTSVTRPLPPSRHLHGRDLLWLGAVVGIGTFVVRIVLVADSNQPLNSHVWAWPGYIAMFGLGVSAARHGWLRPVPSDLARWAGTTTLAVALLMPVVILSAEPLGLDAEAYFGGWNPLALLGAMTEGMVAVSAPIWILAFAQRHLHGTGALRRAMARSSYAAFMLQGPVLVTLAVMLRPTDLPGDAKALVVASLGIACSFALAWPLVTRTPLRRIL